jgi:hypothetical protein
LEEDSSAVEASGKIIGPPKPATLVPFLPECKGDLPRYSVCEVVVRVKDGMYTDPVGAYTGPDVTGVFTQTGGGPSTTVHGFFDQQSGKTVFRIRYNVGEGPIGATGKVAINCQQNGQDCTTNLNLPDGLEFRVVAGTPADAGFLRRDFTTRRFVYGDSDYPFIWGQTYYSIIPNALGNGGWQEAIGQSAMYTSKIRLLIHPFIGYDDSTTHYPLTTPFSDLPPGPNQPAPHQQINVPHWAALDRVVKAIYDQLDKQGHRMLAEIILFPDSRREAFGVDSTEDDRFVRYVAARYAAFPNVVWCMANEWEFAIIPGMTVTDDKDGAVDWKPIIRNYFNARAQTLAAADPWRLGGLHNQPRPLTIHGINHPYNFEFFDQTWPSHAALQFSKNHEECSSVPCPMPDQWSNYSIVQNALLATGVNSNWPIVNDEYGYFGSKTGEKPDPNHPGQTIPICLSQNEARYAMWGVAVGGGYGTFGDGSDVCSPTPIISSSINKSDWVELGAYHDISKMTNFFKKTMQDGQTYNTLFKWEQMKGDNHFVVAKKNVRERTYVLAQEPTDFDRGNYVVYNVAKVQDTSFKLNHLRGGKYKVLFFDPDSTHTKEYTPTRRTITSKNETFKPSEKVNPNHDWVMWLYPELTSTPSPRLQSATTNSYEINWLGDSMPSGATPGGNEAWNWVDSDPLPIEEALAHQSPLMTGLHQHYFTGATETLKVNAGDTLFAYVLLDPANPPSEVMLQWDDGSGTWAHRAFWGADQIPTNGLSTAHYRAGELPEAGDWVRLEVPASAVGLEGVTLNSMAFSVYGGQVTWDTTGKTGVGQPLTNLALNKTATQSSTAFGGVAARAVDGNTNGNANYTHTNSDAQAWWQVDLGSKAAVDQIRIWNRTDCCPERLSAYDVFVSDEPFTSFDPDETQGQAGVATYHFDASAGSPTIIPIGLSVRYVRVQLANTNYLSISEVEVLGISGMPPPPSTPAPAYEGFHEAISCDYITGWVWDQHNPSTRVNLSVIDDNTGTVIATGIANQPRSDLGGRGDGQYGFAILTPASIKNGQTHNLRVRVTGATYDLGFTPLSFNSTTACAPSYEGFHEAVSCSYITGWIWDQHNPSTRVNLSVIDDNTGAVIATGIANQPRSDLGGRGDGRYGFAITTPLSIKNGQTHNVRVKVAGSSYILGFTPLSFNSTIACPPSANLALYKPATQSSVAFGAVAGVAVDGNTNGGGNFTHTNNDLNAWWQVDLSGDDALEQIKIWNRTDCCPERLSNFYVFVSDQPFTSNNPSQVQNTAGVSTYYVAGSAGSPTVVPIGRTGRYVRVQLAGTNYLSISEVQVYGQPNPLPFTPFYEGFHEAVSCGYITGWAWDKNNPGTRVNLSVIDDNTGSVIASGVANNQRLDLGGRGDGQYGFAIPTPAAIKDGPNHNIRVLVTGTTFNLGGTPVSFNSTTAGCAPLFEGFHEAVSCSYITGWVWDQHNPSTRVNLSVYDDNTGNLIASGIANQPRSDLGGRGDGQYGFAIPTPAILKDGQTHSVRVKVTGSTYTLGFTPLSFNPVSAGCSPPPLYEGFHEWTDCNYLGGWVWDKNNPGTRVQVEVIDDNTGQQVATGFADQYRADLVGQGKGDGVHGFGIPVPAIVQNGVVHNLRVKVLGNSYPLGFTPRPYNSLIAGCSPPPATDTVWIEDIVPSATNISNGWNWFTSNPLPVSGSRAHQSTLSITDPQQHYFSGAISPLQINYGDKLFTYVFLDPANPPREIFLQWFDASSPAGTEWNHRAYWGTNEIPWGADGTNERRYMGALPPVGKWVRLEVPASQLGMEGHLLGGVSFGQSNGLVTWDRTGKSAQSSLPPPPPTDVVWVEDKVPDGAISYDDSDVWNWIGANPAPAAGGASHLSNLLFGRHQHVFMGATYPMPVNAGNKLIAYVYLDPANPPTELMLQWCESGSGWAHRAFWGADQIPLGTTGTSAQYNMGVLPAAGQWIRLEVPANLVDLNGRSVNGMAFTLFGGRAAFDHAGKTQ